MQQPLNKIIYDINGKQLENKNYILFRSNFITNNWDFIINEATHNYFIYYIDDYNYMNTVRVFENQCNNFIILTETEKCLYLLKK